MTEQLPTEQWDSRRLSEAGHEWIQMRERNEVLDALYHISQNPRRYLVRLAKESEACAHQSQLALVQGRRAGYFDAGA